MNNWKFTLAVMIGLLGMPLLATGPGLFEPGAQGAGNLGAFVARAEDATAMFYNPAGLAQLEHNEFLFSGKALTSRSFYSNAGQSSWDTDAYIGAFAQLFFSAKFGRVTLGLGTAPSYDWNYEWDESDFPSRFLANEGSFRSQDAYASVAVKLSDHFSIGATYRMVQADSKFSRVLVRPLDRPSLHYEAGETFDGDGDGTGFILGMQYYRSRSFSVGASYQSEVDLDLSGSRSFELLTRTGEPRTIEAFEQTFRNAGYTETMTLPARAAIGLASRITVRTRLEVDVTYQDWSDTISTIYQTTDNQGNPTQVAIPRNWSDSYSVRIAGDFQQRKAWLWRMALASSDRFVPSGNVRPDFVNNDFFQYSFGFSYFRSNKYIFEAAFIYSQNRDRRLNDKEFFYNPNSPDFISSNGQSGLLEAQKYQLTLGMRIRFGASTKRN